MIKLNPIETLPLYIQDFKDEVLVFLKDQPGVAIQKISVFSRVHKDSWGVTAYLRIDLSSHYIQSFSASKNVIIGWIRESDFIPQDTSQYEVQKEVTND